MLGLLRQPPCLESVFPHSSLSVFQSVQIPVRHTGEVLSSGFMICICSGQVPDVYLYVVPVESWVPGLLPEFKRCICTGMVPDVYLYYESPGHIYLSPGVKSQACIYSPGVKSRAYI